MVTNASDTFRNPTSRINELWQTDFTDFEWELEKAIAEEFDLCMMSVTTSRWLTSHLPTCLVAGETRYRINGL